MKKSLVTLLLSLLASTSHANTYSGAAFSGVALNVDTGVTTTTTSSTTTTTTLPASCVWQTAFSAEVDKCAGGPDNGAACTADGDCTPPGVCMLAADIVNVGSGVREYRTAIPVNALDIVGVPTKFRMTWESTPADQAEVDSNSPVGTPNYGFTICPSTTGQACDPGSITNITFNGGAKGAQFTGTLVTDEITYTLDKTKRYLLHQEMDDRSLINYTTGWERWYIQTTLQDLADNEDTTGIMTGASSVIAGIRKIEVCVPGSGQGSNWWDTNYGYRRPLTSADTHSVYDGTADYVTATVDTVSANIKDNCDDLRVIHHSSTGGADTMTELARKVVNCNTANTKVYFKLPYYLNTDANLSQTTNKIYLYYGYSAAVCTPICSSYENINFPQAPLTPAPGTQALYDFETTPADLATCKVCTGDAAFNDKGCAVNGDCGTGTCTASPDLCDISGLSKGHHLQACTSDGNTCVATPVYAADARVGSKAISCTGNSSITYKAEDPTFDNGGATYDMVSMDIWVKNTSYPGTASRRRVFGSDTNFELTYIDMSDAGTACIAGDACTYASEPFGCDTDIAKCGYHRKYLMELMISGSNSWTINTLPDGQWNHIRYEVDDDDDPGVANDTDRWRAYYNGQVIPFFGNSDWVSPLDCTGAGTPYPCCTSPDNGCAAIQPSVYSLDFLVCGSKAVDQPYTGYVDDLRIGSSLLGPPDWVVDELVPIVGAQEAKP